MIQILRCGDGNIDNFSICISWMVVILFISIILCFVSFKNLPLGYTLYLLTKFTIPPFVKFGIDGVSMSYHTFFFFFFLFFCIVKNIFPKMKHDRLIKYTLLWMSVTVILGMTSKDTPFVYNLKGIVQLVRDYGIALLGIVIFTNIKQIKRFYTLLMIVAFFSCIYGLYEYITKNNPYVEYLVLEYDGIPMYETFKNDVRGLINGRIQGLTNHPLTHGQIMSVVFPFALILYRKTLKAFYLLLMILLLLNIFLAGSRASIISTILFITLMLFNKRNYKKCITFVMIIPLLSLSIGSKLSDEIASTMKNMIFFWDENPTNNIRGSSVDSRLLQYAYLTSNLGTKLSVGHGIGYAQYDFEKNGDHPIMHGYESILLKKIAEVGVIGLIIYILWYFKVYLYLIGKMKLSSTSKYLKEIKCFLLTYFVCILLTGDFSSSVYFILLLIFYKYTVLLSSASLYRIKHPTTYY